MVKIQRFIAVLMLEKDIKDCENDHNVIYYLTYSPHLEVLKENTMVLKNPDLSLSLTYYFKADVIH